MRQMNALYPFDETRAALSSSIFRLVKRKAKDAIYIQSASSLVAQKKTDVIEWLCVENAAHFNRDNFIYWYKYVHVIWLILFSTSAMKREDDGCTVHCTLYSVQSCPRTYHSHTQSNSRKITFIHHYSKSLRPNGRGRSTSTEKLIVSLTHWCCSILLYSVPYNMHFPRIKFQFD